MNHYPDEYDLERSYELERRLDRDHEPYRRQPQRRRSTPRYFAGLVFRPITVSNDVNDIEQVAA
ncbi:hypothetical protein BH11MYX1_BH11MYX1_56510 [soil metagenome]